MKKLWLITLTLIMALTLCFGLTACGDKTVEQLQNELGALLEGGNFKEGSVLNVNDITAERATEILGKLEDNGITIDDETKAYIYDIFVTKDNSEVQPDGKVKVTVPMPADEKAEGYNVYHMKDNGAVEVIPSTYKDGKVSFETDGFSSYIFTPTYNCVVSGILDSDVTGIVVDTDNTVVYDPNGDTPLPNFESVKVTAVAPNGTFVLSADKYTIDLGGLDATKPGSYTVTYTYNKNTDIKATVNVVVLNEAVRIMVENYGWGGHTDILGEIFVEKGEEVTINAYLDDEERFIFSGWYQNDFGTRVAGAMTYTFTATEDVTLIARFEKNTKVDLIIEAYCMSNGMLSDQVDILVDGFHLKEENMEMILRQLHVGKILHLEAHSPDESLRFVGWYEVRKNDEFNDAVYREPISEEMFLSYQIRDLDVHLIALFADDTPYSNAQIIGADQDGELIVNGESVGISTTLEVGKTYTFDVNIGEDYRFLYWQIEEYNRSFTIENVTLEYKVIPASRHVYAVCEPIFVDMKMAYGKDEYTFKAGDDVFAQLQSADVRLFLPSGSSMWSTYGQTHTIDYVNLDPSKVGTYCIVYECLSNPELYAKVTVHIISTEISFNATANKGTLMIDGEDIGSAYSATYADGYGKVTLTAKGVENTVFKGWYVVNGNTTELVSTDETFTFEIDKTTSVYADFEYVVTDLVVDMGDLIYDVTLLEKYESISIPDFNAICKEGGTSEKWKTDYIIFGKIKSISNTTWGNMIIVDDQGNELHVYGLYLEDGTRYGKMETKPAVGDFIAVHGKPYLYGTEPEMQKGYLLNATPILPSFENVTVHAYTPEGSSVLRADEFTVNTSALNPAKPGEYLVTYTYKENPEIKATVTVKVLANAPVDFSAWVNGGTLLLDGVEIGPDYFETFKDGFGKITLTAVGEENTVFKGWYTNEDNPTLISTDATYTFEFDENIYVYAEFEYTATEIWLDGMNMGFDTDGGITNIYLPVQGTYDPNRILVFALINGEPEALTADEYTIDLGGFNGTNPAKGDYVLTFTYKANPELKATHMIRVLDEENLVNFNASSAPGGRVNVDKPYDQFNKGEQVTVTVELRSESDYEFLGWYTVDASGAVGTTCVSTERTYTVTLNETTYLYAKIEPKITRLEVEGYEGEPTRIHISKFWLADREIKVYACGALGKRVELTANDYTVDMGGLNLTNPVVGKYTITYTYKADTSITYTVTVWVYDADYTFSADQDSPDNGWLLFEGSLTHAVEPYQYISGEEITITAAAKEGYTFLGWYLAIDHDTHVEYELITTDATYTFTIDKDTKIQAKFGAPVTEIDLGGANPITVYRGEFVDLSHIGVWSYSLIESRNLNTDEYTVDLGGLDVNDPVAGTYTITYTYKETPELTATLTVTVLKRSYYVEVTSDSGRFKYNGDETMHLFEKIEEGTTIVLEAVIPNPMYRAFLGWNKFDYETGEWKLYSTNKILTLVVEESAEGEIRLRPVYGYVTRNLEMYVMGHNKLYEAGVQHWNFDDMGYWDEELGRYIACGNIDLYADSEYATDIAKLFENFHIFAADCNGHRQQISHEDLTIDLGDYKAEEGWYEIKVSYGSFTMTVNVMVMPAENA
ncbi:MAG: hypothetical protein E7659_05525 [Ruminococcaceae bacterium]|nr:hypothetical protein [Oscillospiraceae bacterium]